MARPPASGPRSRPRRRSTSTAFLVLVGGLGAGCITTYEEDPSIAGVQWSATSTAATQPPSIPFAPVVVGSASVALTDEQRTLLELYHGVLERMQAAVADRDDAALAALLEAYDRPNLPTELRDRLDGYQALRRGLSFERHALANATLTEVAPTPGEFGTVRGWELVLPAMSVPTRLGGRDDDDPIGFAVEVTVDDLFVTGSRRRANTQDFARLPEAVDLVGDAVVRVPVAVDLPAAADAVRREIHVRIEMMPGYVLLDGVRAPIQRTPLGAAAATVWPEGEAAVRARPLATLREAIRLGDAAHFRHMFLGALFTPETEREQALASLIDVVRHGRPAQAHVATAALREITGVQSPIGDREAWLAWWQTRR